MFRQTLRYGVIVLGGWLMAVAAVQAHHSLAATYAMGDEGQVSGAFKEFRIVNPHSSMKMDVTNDDGSVTEWTFTGGSVSTLARLGLGQDGRECAQARRPDHRHLHAGAHRGPSARASEDDHLRRRAGARVPGRLAHAVAMRRRSTESATRENQ